MSFDPNKPIDPSSSDVLLPDEQPSFHLLPDGRTWELNRELLDEQQSIAAICPLRKHVGQVFQCWVKPPFNGRSVRVTKLDGTHKVVVQCVIITNEEYDNASEHDKHPWW